MGGLKTKAYNTNTKKIDRKQYKERGWKVWEEFYPCGGGAG